ncbi:MAG: geranylgeranyl reductase family protein [Pseudomonadota bacterium]
MNTVDRVERFDVIVVGGGPAGATAAETLGRQGHSVLVLERDTRIKPCGGAIPPRLIRDFQIPDDILCARINEARIVAPSERFVDMPIDGGFVGMVDRETFDPWLLNRACEHPTVSRRRGAFQNLFEGADCVRIEYQDLDAAQRTMRHVEARIVIGADGANSTVVSQGLYRKSRLSLVTDRAETLRYVPGENPMHHVVAYHEIVETPPGFDAAKRCDVYYDGELSPDFYGWVFPHGNKLSIGAGTAQRRFQLREAVAELRLRAGLANARTIRTEGSPIPLHPLKRWDNGRNIIAVGDAVGVVAPSSGEGIYYAMASGHLAGEAVSEALKTDNPLALRDARKQFMRSHGQTFRMLAMMQRFWYRSDERRERFVKICRDRDVQQLTWTAYMNKRLVRAKPVAHARIFFKNVGHLTGLAPA